MLDRPEEQVAILLGYAEQEADGLHGQLGGHVEEEVAFVAHPLEQRPHAPAQLVLEVPDGAPA